MMKYSVFSIFIISFIYIFVASGDIHAAGQSSTNYKIEADVISGGGSDASSTNYYNESTLGQSTDGEPSSSSNYDNYPGFWNVVTGLVTPSYNQYDTNHDCEIGNFELLTAINLWAAIPPQLTNFELLGLINLWAGGSYC